MKVLDQPANKNAEYNTLFVEKVEEVFFDIFNITYNGADFTLEGKRVDGNVYVCVNVDGHGYIPVRVVVGEGGLVLGKSNNKFLTESPAKNDGPVFKPFQPVPVPFVVEKEKIVKVKIAEPEIYDYINNQIANTQNIIKKFVKESYKLIEEKISDQGSTLLEQFNTEVANLDPQITNTIKGEVKDNFNKIKDIVQASGINSKKELIDLIEKNVNVVNKNIESILNKKQTELTENITLTLQRIEDQNTKLLKETTEQTVNNIQNVEQHSIDLLNNEIVKRFEKVKDKIKTESLLAAKNLKEAEIKFNEQLDEKCGEVLKAVLIKEDAISQKCDVFNDILEQKENTIESKITNAYDELKSLVNNLVQVVKEDVESAKEIINNAVSSASKSLLTERKNDFVSKSEMQKLRLEMHNQNMFMRKLIGSMGGGSVAQQFAAGGIMNGTLDVMGNYLSAGQNLMSVFDQRYVPMGMKIDLTPEQVQTALTNLGVNTYTATVTAASDVWYINHNLDRLNLSINTYTNDIEVMGSERLIDSNNVEITFTMPITGMVVIS